MEQCFREWVHVLFVHMKTQEDTLAQICMCDAVHFLPIASHYSTDVQVATMRQETQQQKTHGKLTRTQTMRVSMQMFSEETCGELFVYKKSQLSFQKENKQTNRIWMQVLELCKDEFSRCQMS